MNKDSSHATTPESPWDSPIDEESSVPKPAESNISDSHSSRNTLQKLGLAATAISAPEANTPALNSKAIASPTPDPTTITPDSSPTTATLSSEAAGNHDYTSLSFTAPAWLSLYSDDYPTSSYDLITGQPISDGAVGVSVETFSPDFAERLEKIRSSSDVDFNRFALNLITDEDPSHLDTYQHLSDHSLTQVAALSSALGPYFHNLPKHCQTDRNVDQYYHTVRELLDSFDNLELPQPTKSLSSRLSDFSLFYDSFDESEENIAAREDHTTKESAITGAITLVNAFIQDFRPNVYYDLPAIIDLTKTQLCTPKISSGNSYNNRISTIADLRYNSCQALAEGNPPESVDQYINLCTQISDVYQRLWQDADLPIPASTVAKSALMNQLENLNYTVIEHQFPRPDRLTSLSEQVAALDHACLPHDDQPPTHDYTAILQFYHPNFAQRLHSISNQSKVNTSNLALHFSLASRQGLHLLDFEELPDPSLKKLANLQNVLDYKGINDMPHTETAINQLYQNVGQLTGELLQLDNIGPNTLKLTVRHLAQAYPEHASSHVADIKYALDIAKSQSPTNSDPDAYQYFISSILEDAKNNHLSIRDAADYSLLLHDTRQIHSKLTTDTLINSHNFSYLLPQEYSTFANSTANVIDDISDRLSGLNPRLAIHFFQNYGLTDHNAIGFRDHLIPLLEDDDPEIESLSRRLTGQSLRGEHHLADFQAACFTSTISPRTINLLSLEQRILPTGNLRKLEQNRIDSLALEGSLLPNHDFVHFESPLTHPLLSTMLKYYDAQDTTDFTQATKDLNQIVAECQSCHDAQLFGVLANYVFDLKNYDYQINKTVNDDQYSRPYQESTVDILRRLVKNTAPNPLEIPDVKDETLKQLMESARPYHNSKTNALSVDWRDASLLTAYLNSKLQSLQGTTSIRPSLIQAITYTERIATFALRNLNLKEWRELLYDPGFKEILKFHELTDQAIDFSPQGFEDFYQGLLNRLGSNPTDDHIRDQYYRIQSHILNQLNSLAKVYNSTGKSEYVNTLWSNNLAHKLINLTDTPAH